MAGLTALRERYLEVKARTERAVTRRSSGADSLLLVADTSAAEPEEIRALVEMGHVDFGEHRIQNLQQRVVMTEEFLERHRTLPATRDLHVPPQVRWHMLGPIPRQRTRKLLELIKLAHTVDNLRIAEAVQDGALHRDEPVDVLLQVNTARDQSVPGISIPAAMHVAELIDTMVHLRLRGLTAHALPSDDAEAARPTFQRCRELFGEIRTAGIAGKSFNILCMGDSSTFEVAIEEGANLVCVGEAIFGKRRESSAPSTLQPA